MVEVALPIPFQGDNKLIDTVDMEAPKPIDIANLEEGAQNGRPYAGMIKYLQGIVNIPKHQVSSIPFRSAEYVIVQSIKSISETQTLEGVYTCPRCSTQIICEGDDADQINDIEISFAGGESLISLELNQPVHLDIKSSNKSKTHDTISSLTFRYPTLRDCDRAGKNGGTPMEQNLRIYAQAIQEVNGEAVSEAWKSGFGWAVMKQLSLKDARKLFKAGELYGMDTGKQRVCPGCGKKWKEPLNIADFFSSALAPE